MSSFLQLLVLFFGFTLYANTLIAQDSSTVAEAQTIARLYSASLNRPPLTGGLNFYIRSLESGRTVISIAKDFVQSAEFVEKYGELNNKAYIERLFLNVLGRPGAQGGIDFWVDNLTSGKSRAFVLSQFADSPENIANSAILFDSMALVDGQWQYSRVDDFLLKNCGNNGCLQTELNGAVAGAQVTITSLRDATPLGEPISSFNESDLSAFLGTGVFNDLSSLERLQLLGLFPPVTLQPGQLYLLTTQRGSDFDNDLNQQVDDQPTPVAGSLHAIVTAEHLAGSMQINVMTEATYLSLLPSLSLLSDEQVLGRLDDAAAKLVKNINRDDSVDYLDMLAWRRLFDNERIRTDLVDVNKLAVALSTGQEAGSLQILSNRVLGGAAAIGLDETSAVAINPDGTCEGRGRTVINLQQESITTAPPTSVCGEDDTGQVDSNQGEVLGAIIPGADGLARSTEIRLSNNDARRNSFEFSEINPTTNELVVDYTDSNGNRRRGAVAVNATDAPEELSRRFRSLKDQSVGTGSIPSNKKESKSADFAIATAEGDIFTETLTESMSYGALASNFTACVVYRFITQREALGESIEQDVRSWALSGCTSALAEVNTWASERTATEIVNFETAVPEVELAGCSDCYSYIASPEDGATVTVDRNVGFNGVAPASSTAVAWDFGDGGTSDNRAPFHAYSDPGTYQAEFLVDYNDGSVGVNQLMINVSLPCTLPPEVSTRFVNDDGRRGFGLVFDATTSGENCFIAEHQWVQIGGSPQVMLGFDDPEISPFFGFFCPDDPNQTVLMFEVTVLDTGGNVGKATLTTDYCLQFL